MVARNVRQPIPVIATASDIDADQVSDILRVLDRALELSKLIDELPNMIDGYIIADTGRVVTFFEGRHKHAPYAFRLWASAREFAIDENLPSTENGHVHALYVRTPSGRAVASLHLVDEPPNVVGGA